MKSNLFVTAALCFGVSVASAGSAPQKLEALPTDMEQFTVYAQDVKSVDILIDYKMVPVSCHGNGTFYSQVQNKRTAEIFVSIEQLAHTMSICPPSTHVTMGQMGLKIKAKPAQGSDMVFRTVIVPKGSVVEIVKYPAQQSNENQFVCQASVNCMPPAGLNNIFCSAAYMDWAAQNCETTPIQLQ